MNLPAQNNIVKGRIIGLPGDNPKTFSLGIGYERFLNEHISAQILLNRYAFDQSATDGSSNYTTAVVPEFRNYFREKEFASQSFFWAIFLEFQWIESRVKLDDNISSGPVQVVERPYSNAVCPGILIGKNFRLSEKWHIEAYLGPKFFEEKETYIYQYPDGHKEEKQERAGRLGVRAGMNVAYCF